MNFKAIFMALLGTAMVLFSQKVWAQDELDLLDMSLEDLMNMEVTSVSKKAERLQDVASSIYVLNADDINKSGATTLHEALRLVPGYWGTQTQYSEVDGSVRFSKPANSEIGTVLFLLDGTPIQNLTNSSFSFNNFDIPLDEIDRIEVIRGSGGTIYGANSATGVVNIFTKSPDQYDGVNARGEIANGGYTNLTLRAGGSLSDNFSLSAYGKYRYFSGFESLRGRNENGNEVVPNSRFTKNYDENKAYSFGVKSKYEISDQSSISFGAHLNRISTIQYSNSFGPLFQFNGQDDLFENEMDGQRIVANVRFDQQFSEDHSLFVRLSTNSEKDFSKVSGGYESNNAIYDLEIQDNLSLSENNDLTVGLNYRLVDIEIANIVDPTSLGFVNPKTTESLKGLFVQDRIRIMEGKLNFQVGLKAENYSLINDDYYISPMAKFSYIPSESFTLWGGYTLSYSTPGFNNTNIDLFLFQAPPAQSLSQLATQGVYQGLVEGQIAQGASETEATAYADAAIQAPQAQGAVQAITDSLVQALPNIAVINGTDTQPTQFSTFEIGFRNNFNSKFLFESNFYYTTIKDGIGVSFNPVFDNLQSPGQPGRFADYYVYGNYLQGVTYGTESMIRVRPTAHLSLELAHTWIRSTWEYQVNDDFDINNTQFTGSRDQTPDTPYQPEHIIKLRSDYSFGQGFNISAGLIYASEISTQSRYFFDEERYANVVLEPRTDRTTVAKNSDRTIVNLRVEKKLIDDQLTIYAFGNDVFNKGIVANTNPVFNVSLSQISAMYGVGVNYRIK